jgi:hypothetical protein
MYLTLTRLKSGVRSSLATGLILVMFILASGVIVPVNNTTAEVVPAEPATTIYSEAIGAKLISRCNYVKDYLSQTFRINELASRSSNVRGWEYILQNIESLRRDYERLNKDYTNLDKFLITARAQLDQFKKDFESYDQESQKLIAMDCITKPDLFWAQLNTVRSYRSGIALAAENFELGLSNILKAEEVKW